ncbi:glycosyltransferase family 4 protein [Streptomyces sp. NPDC002676]
MTPRTPRDTRPSALRIALVHSFYGSGAPSGENETVSEQADALRRAGHEVELIAARTDELQRAPSYALFSALTVAGGHGRSPLRRLRAFSPDVVHVHNLFPNFGRAWAREWDGPLVATLHNFRPLCAAATLYREGSECTRCPDGDRWAGLRYGCYRGSRAATLPLAWAGRRGAAGDPVLRRADRVVVLSESSRDIYVRAGMPPRRLALVRNFVRDVAGEGDGSGPWVYVGRLSPEKGIAELLRRWPADEPLDVIGSGESESECRAVAPSSVRFLGVFDRAGLRRRLPSWRGLVFPSRCMEGAVPLVYLEALAAGLPVFALEGSSVPRIVQAQGTGHVVGWEEPLGPALARAGQHFPALRAHCRQVFAEHYCEQVWVTRIRRVYEEARWSRQEARPTA